MLAKSERTVEALKHTCNASCNSLLVMAMRAVLLHVINACVLCSSAFLSMFTQVKICPAAPMMRPMQDPVLIGGIWNLDSNSVQVKRIEPRGEELRPKRARSRCTHECREMASDLIGASAKQ